MIFAAGTGNPFFTTDSAAALRANELHAEVLLKATNVEGVFSADPRTDEDAELLREVTYQQVLERNLRVMDAAAISLCRDNDLPIVVFNLLEKGNIRRVVRGERVGLPATSCRLPATSCRLPAAGCQLPARRVRLARSRESLV